MQVKDNKAIICPSCGELKPISEFYCSRTKTGRVYTSRFCKICKRMKVRLSYYETPRMRRRTRKGTTYRDESQPQLFKVVGNDVFAKLYFYDAIHNKWVFEWFGISSRRNPMECYHFIAIARDLPMRDIKRYASRYYRIKGDSATAKVLED